MCPAHHQSSDDAQIRPVTNKLHRRRLVAILKVEMSRLGGARVICRSTEATNTKTRVHISNWLRLWRYDYVQQTLTALAMRFLTPIRRLSSSRISAL